MVHRNHEDIRNIWPDENPHGDTSAEDLKNVVNGEDVEPESEYPLPPPPKGWPKPMSEDALHGLAGDFVRLVLPETEADRQALLLCFLVEAGCYVGRKPYCQVEATRHGVNLSSVLVGNTSTGRKGSANDRVSNILTLVDKQFMQKRMKTGLSSGEGLIEAVRDKREGDVEIKDPKTGAKTLVHQVVDNGVEDKRLLIIEPEFSSVLQQFARPGNTLSSKLRCAFDGKAMSVLAKGNKDSCAEPHICILGHTTPEELPRLLTTTEMANGSGNRILWCCCRRSKVLPHSGRPLDKAKLDLLVSGLKKALDGALRIGQVTFDSDAYREWPDVYRMLTEDVSGLFGAMTARAAPLVLRLATLYAVLDGSNLIKTPHLRAAQAVWLYCEDSVWYIFGDALGDETADAILRMLRAASDGMTRTEINRGFGSHKSAKELDRALNVLLKHDKVTSEQIEADDGRPATFWRVKGA